MVLISHKEALSADNNSYYGAKAPYELLGATIMLAMMILTVKDVIIKEERRPYLHPATLQLSSYSACICVTGTRICMQ